MQYQVTNVNTSQTYCGNLEQYLAYLKTLEAGTTLKVVCSKESTGFPPFPVPKSVKKVFSKDDLKAGKSA